jgi:hypothetical protein
MGEREFMQSQQKHIVVSNEKGMVLVITIMLLAVLMLLGSTAIVLTNTDTKISSNYRSGSQAFYIAEAGLEQARDQLRINYGSGSTLSQLLAARVGVNGVLSNSSNITNFYSNGGFVTDDVPYIANTVFGAGSYRVYLTNDAKAPDILTSTTDTNLRLTLTSFGQGPDNSFAIIQSVVEAFNMPPIPGAIVLPGPTVVYAGANSNASSVAGGSESAISLNSAAAESSVESYLSGIHRINNYTCNATSGAACINNETIPPAYSTLSGINGLYDTIKSMADTVLTGTSTLTAAQVGTTTNRKIVVVEGNATLGPVNGAGILLVTGQLTLNGNFDYHGLIVVAGQGSLLRNGGGNGQIVGGIFVANTNNAISDTVLGTPIFDTSGGGNSDIIYDGSQLNQLNGKTFFKRSWKQM